MPIEANTPEYVSNLILSDHYILQHYAKNLFIQGSKTGSSKQNPFGNTEEISELFDMSVRVINKNEEYLATCANLLSTDKAEQFKAGYQIANRNTELEIIPIFQNWPDNHTEIDNLIKHYNQWHHIDWQDDYKKQDYMRKYIETGLACEKLFRKAITG